MGILYGKDLVGLIGSLVFKRGKGGKKIVQTRPREYTQNPQSVRTSTIFGYGSSVAAIIRRQLQSTFGQNYDPEMVNRFNKPIKEVLFHCYNSIEESFTFQEDSFSRLIEFEFNVKSPLINYLWVKPLMTITENVLKITIPEFNIPSGLTFPARTNFCKMSITICQANINQGIIKYTLYFTFDVDKDQETYPEREITINVENQCLCIAAIGLYYTEKKDDVSLVYNSKLFGPANVINALITPGIYVARPTPPISHVSHSKEWSFDPKLKF
jgi:hypothetical protein